MNYLKTPRFLLSVKRYFENLSSTDIILYTILFSSVDSDDLEIYLESTGSEYYIHSLAVLSEMLNATVQKTLKSLHALQKLELVDFRLEDDLIKFVLKQPKITREDLAAMNTQEVI